MPQKNDESKFEEGKKKREKTRIQINYSNSRKKRMVNGKRKTSQPYATVYR